MSGIEVAGIVLGSIPLLISSIEHWKDLVSFRPFTLSLRRNARDDEYGLLMSWTLRLFFRDALDVMTRVERYVLRAEDQHVIAFMKSYTASFNMIGVAGAIIAQVAITAISLTNLTDSHWTAQACFIISLVTGALSVYFSCAINPAFHGLHSADDIKDFLTKPTRSANQKRLRAQLRALESLMEKLKGKLESPPRQLKQTLYEEFQGFGQILFEEKWKVASCYSAMMLVAPMNLLNISLNAFLLGLGIYLGKVYTAHLIPSFGSGSLGLLIIFIISSLFAIALFYVPEGLKSVESEPIQRFAAVLDEINQIQPEESTEERRSLEAADERPVPQSASAEEPQSSADEPQEVRSESNTVRQSTHVRNGSKVTFEVKSTDGQVTHPPLDPPSRKLREISRIPATDDAGPSTRATDPIL
ncbi:uncharacterized protein BDZ99DRAFT_253159 [Mytilinidion resinicola]|uniref:Uncharacterized protein n=1 Tax=Mytilinidion resinicola TaxID=574789 RepID=A0A6A6YZD3_9PEZI|nr:uncharacterized protein BDZ99DRAFT_253159 [Mytilinidion resinicola]KAF2813285.1 hypothetical protein BDZ99DRAFT_253159 [Mytilinidion resinicola]